MAQHRGPFALTPEIWAHIFAFLEDEHTAVRSFTEIQSRREVQQRLQLRMVCKQFNDVYAIDMHRLNLPVSFPTSALPGLLAWLRQSRVSITVFEANGDSVTDAILGAFVLSSAPLRVVDVSRVSSCSMELLSAFRCLKQCSLGSSAELEDLQDLSPLRNLPNLTDLLLCGHFCGLNMLQHLTSLQLQNSVAKASDICNFASILQKLMLEDSDLYGLHPRGLSACTSLRLLQLSESVLYDQSEDLQFSRSLSIMPVGIGIGRSLSSQLDTLHLLTDNDQIHSLAVDWIYDLSSLKDIAIECNHCNADLLVRLTKLTNLNKLSLKGDSITCVNLDIEWHHLQALQFLSVVGFTVVCGQHLVSLLQLERLTHVCFDGLTPHSSRCAGVLLHLCITLPHHAPRQS